MSSHKVRDCKLFIIQQFHVCSSLRGTVEILRGAPVKFSAVNGHNNVVITVSALKDGGRWGISFPEEGKPKYRNSSGEWGYIESSQTGCRS